MCARVTNRPQWVGQDECSVENTEGKSSMEEVESHVHTGVCWSEQYAHANTRAHARHAVRDLEKERKSTPKRARQTRQTASRSPRAETAQ
jgi:hypothetical protein